MYKVCYDLPMLERMLFEVTSTQKNFILEVLEKKKGKGEMGFFRHWVTPVIIKAAEKELGISFEEWLEKRGYNEKRSKGKNK